VSAVDGRIVEHVTPEQALAGGTAFIPNAVRPEMMGTVGARPMER